jgi:hypothetical protein
MRLGLLSLRWLPFIALTLVAAPSGAGTKLDLSPYVAVLGSPGDYAVYALSTGGQRKTTLLAVEPWKKGWREVSETVWTGTDRDGGVTREAYLIPGKRVLLGNEIPHDGEFAFFKKKPSKGLKLLTKPGKAQKLKSKARLLLSGVEVAKARWTGAWVDDGFETVTTPAGMFPDALRAQVSETTRIANRFQEVVVFSEATVWYAAGFGRVRTEEREEVYENGRLVDTRAWVEELVEYDVAP